MSAQVDLDLLADYVGGALDGTPEAERVAQLIAGSPPWRQAAADLTVALSAVSKDLELMRGMPEAMPPDLAEHFDELLRRPPVDPLTQRTLSRPVKSRRRRWQRWAAPIAVAAAALTFFMIVRMPATGVLFRQPASNPEAGKSALDMAVGQEPVLATYSGRQYDRSTLQAWRSSAGSPLSKASGKVPEFTPSSAQTADSALSRLTTEAGLKSCLSAVNVVLPGRATSVDFAYFEGPPALVISITATPGEWIFVAGVNCGISGPDEKFRTKLR